MLLFFFDAGLGGREVEDDAAVIVTLISSFFLLDVSVRENG